MKIEKNIPIPEITSKRYPFDEMEVGDSFLVPPLQVPSARSLMSYTNRKDKSKSFMSRTSEDGIRIWRIR
jgi:hypothetical protein